MRRYTATAHALFAQAPPESHEDALALARQRAKVFGVAELVIVQRGEHDDDQDHRYRTKIRPYTSERPSLWLVEVVYPTGPVQLSLPFRVYLHPPLRLLPPERPTPSETGHPALSLFPVPQEGV